MNTQDIQPACSEAIRAYAMRECPSIMREFAADKRDRAAALPLSKGERIRALYCDAAMLDGLAKEIEDYINRKIANET